MSDFDEAYAQYHITLSKVIREAADEVDKVVAILGDDDE